MQVTDEVALENIAANVRRLRADRSRSWLAREVQSFPINITRIEEKKHMPGAGLLSRLAEALGVTERDLLHVPAAKKNSRKSRQAS